MNSSDVAKMIVDAINTGTLDDQLWQLSVAVRKRRLTALLRPQVGQLVVVTGVRFEIEGAIGKVTNVKITRATVQPISGPWGKYKASHGVDMPISALVVIDQVPS